MIKRTIGQNLREIRERTGDQGKKKTQQEVADDLNVNKNTVYKWENDLVQLNASQIVRLADYYGVSTDELLRGGKARNLVMINETGLSDQTIDRLRKNKAEEKSDLAEVVNLLFDTKLSDHKLLPTSGEMLISAIHDYLSCDERRVFDDPSEGGKYISSMDQLYLLRIIQELQILRDKYQETRDQKDDTVRSFCLSKLSYSE